MTRLKASAELSEDDARIILSLPYTLREVKAGWEIVRDGDRPSQACVILDGLSCRFKVLGEGARQIVSVHIKGDMPDFQSLYLERMVHNLATLAPSTIALVPHRSLMQAVETSPRLATLFWRESLIDSCIAQEWICNVGRRPAVVRVAHVVCELFVRYRAVDGNDGWSIPFELKQTDLGDAQGLSAVHVHRVLKVLKAEGLLSVAKKRLTIHDWDRLQRMADFDASYLHLRETHPR